MVDNLLNQVRISILLILLGFFLTRGLGLQFVRIQTDKKIDLDITPPAKKGPVYNPLHQKPYIAKLVKV